MSALVLALPSKGRLQERASEWLADCDARLTRSGGDRGYVGALDGFDDVEVRLLSAREIALGLDAGDLHVGVTGEDLLHEVSAVPDARLHILRRLGFGRADLVVAAPISWIDVDLMADLEDVAARERRRRGRQMRVATKYHQQTRRFFASRGVADYRIVDSQGATEGAPASGAADVIVDITTTGRTLAANHLKVLRDGVIQRSQAALTASLGADWSDEALAALSRLIDRIEARAAGAAAVRLHGVRDEKAYAALQDEFGARPDSDGAGAICPAVHAHAASAELRRLTGAAVTVTPVRFVFEPTNPVFDRFAGRLSGRPARNGG